MSGLSRVLTDLLYLLGTEIFNYCVISHEWVVTGTHRFIVSSRYRDIQLLCYQP